MFRQIVSALAPQPVLQTVPARANAPATMIAKSAAKSQQDYFDHHPTRTAGGQALFAVTSGVIGATYGQTFAPGIGAVLGGIGGFALGLSYVLLYGRR